MKNFTSCERLSGTTQKSLDNIFISLPALLMILKFQINFFTSFLTLSLNNQRRIKRIELYSEKTDAYCINDWDRCINYVIIEKIWLENVAVGKMISLLLVPFPVRWETHIKQMWDPYQTNDLGVIYFNHT